VIATLRFDGAGRPRFEPATNVRLATVCRVANSVTDAFERLLDCDVAIDVFEPVIVPLGSQPELFADARVFLGHGRRSDLLVVIRRRDAARLAACAFREAPASFEERDLSAIEERVIERLARELTTLAAPLCGEIASFAPANGAIEQYPCATYFELRLGSPIEATIGLGLSRDDAMPSDERLSPAALSDVRVALHAQLASTKMTARRVSRLAVGDTLGFDTSLGDSASLLAGRVPVALGHCGVTGTTLAFRVSERIGAST